MKPEWIIYKNDQRIGQGITWHKALDVLMKQESLNCLPIKFVKYYNLVSISIEKEEGLYKIVEER